jgi:septum formation protein
MSPLSAQFILASRSPQRLELLRQIVPETRIEVRPPRSAVERGFAGLADQADIESRLIETACAKCDDVLDQLAAEQTAGERNDLWAVIAADTIIVGTAADGSQLAIGKPPDDQSWRETVRVWFRDYYAGKRHLAATALCVASSTGASRQRVVKTEVTFRADADRWLDWYLATDEPIGKAGGYALQGAGNLFVEHVAGSVSNVIGLPLAELWEVLGELGFDLSELGR